MLCSKRLLSDRKMIRRTKRAKVEKMRKPRVGRTTRAKRGVAIRAGIEVRNRREAGAELPASRSSRMIIMLCPSYGVLSF